MTIDAGAFRYVQQFVRERTAIVLDDGKRYLVETRLTQLAHREKLGSAQDVIDQLRLAPFGALQRKVVEAMTTTETLFFRDVKPYAALQSTVLPAMIRARSSQRRLRIWSCASSSGQEPYSIAMVIREHFPELSLWDARIVATDISNEMLERSRAGVYTQLEVNRGLPVAFLMKYFESVGVHWQVRPELRRMLELRELNLATTWTGLPTMDVVFLRNVLIYFDVDTKRQILARVRQVLRPDGYLFLGTAETTMGLDDAFEQVRSDGATYFRLRAA